jgi:hypothetical protein
MRKFCHSVSIIVICLSLILTGCIASETPLPTTSVPTSKPMELPTDTVTPSSTPTVTAIPPTPTISPPEKSLNYLDGVQVVHLDTFEKAKGDWRLGNGYIKDGELVLFGKEWTPVYRNREFKVNEGIIVDFQFTSGPLFDMLFESGEWGTEGYKQIGIYIEGNQAKSNVWKGKTWLGGVIINSNMPLKPDKTYTMLLAVLPDGELLEVIWDPTDPLKAIQYRQKIQEVWSYLSWTFLLVADKSTVRLDNFREIKFEGIKNNF